MSTPPRSKRDHAAHSVLVIPELFLLIYGILDKVDRVKLLCLSHETFAYISPLIWEEVDLKHLLLLIPGVSLKSSAKKSSYISRFGNIVVQSYDMLRFPPSIDLARFGIYSPFIKVLRATELSSANSPGSLPNLGIQASPEILLPNLERLLIYTYATARTEFIHWVSGLLAPNLREIKMLLADQRDSSGFDCPSPHATLHPEAYLNWVDKIVSACPQLEALQLFSSESNTVSSNHTMTGREVWGRGILLELGLDDEEDPNYMLHLAGLHKISSLSNLRSLSTSVSEIDQVALQVLGQMPHLETLFLYSNQHHRSQLPPPPINLPDGSFASLRNLRLDRTRPSFFQRIITPVPLFQKLAKASIKVDES
ncbi:hypothetical protein FS749_009051 [Ceratobasidium sp. UAMH 11750]|nr:hypothetical protein FS749_009051 [Ceratobasidium sp. UAMH 11750]